MLPFFFLPLPWLSSCFVRSQANKNTGVRVCVCTHICVISHATTHLLYSPLRLEHLSKSHTLSKKITAIAWVLLRFLRLSTLSVEYFYDPIQDKSRAQLLLRSTRGHFSSCKIIIISRGNMRWDELWIFAPVTHACPKASGESRTLRREARGLSNPSAASLKASHFLLKLRGWTWYVKQLINTSSFCSNTHPETKLKK